MKLWRGPGHYVPAFFIPRIYSTNGLLGPVSRRLPPNRSPSAERRWASLLGALPRTSGASDLNDEHVRGRTPAPARRYLVYVYTRLPG